MQYRAQSLPSRRVLPSWRVLPSRRVLASGRGVLVLGAAAGLVLGTGAGMASAQTQTAMAQTAGAQSAGAATSAWHKAIEVPGSAALNTAGDAGIDSVSCGASGDCLATGVFSAPANHDHPFLVTQSRGKWGQAQRVVGMPGLDRGNNAEISSASCTSPGNCTIGGFYEDRADQQHAWVASQVRGKWARARQLPGMAALTKGNRSTVGSLSCTSIGNCSAEGSYIDSKGNTQPFVVSEVKGTWRDIQPVPGLAALATAGSATMNALSCHSAGNCSAGGNYEDGQFNQDGYVVSQVNGTWRQAEAIPGLKALNTGGGAVVSSVACGSAGNCVAGGNYIDVPGDRFTFVVSQVNGTWGTAQQVPGMAGVVKGGFGQVDTLACSTAGNCAVGGIAGDNNGFDINGGGQAFVATETSGTWGKAELVPGTARLNTGVDGGSTTLSCPHAGDCTVAGYYGLGAAGQKVYNMEAFVDSQTSGKWGQAQLIPGLAALDKKHNDFIGEVSCPAQGHCSAGGGYSPSTNHGQAFVTSQT